MNRKEFVAQMLDKLELTPQQLDMPFKRFKLRFNSFVWWLFLALIVASMLLVGLLFCILVSNLI
jgi:hypothetical protein